MCNGTKSAHGKIYVDGFTLIELIMVITILAILVLIAIPFFLGYVKAAKEEVCNANCPQLDRKYQMYLLMEEAKHTEIIFDKFMQEHSIETCPDNGAIDYKDGKVQCEVHCKHNDENSGNDDGSTPFI
ncbi:prepilin-type N-terminal cleavage/methylation domain-containing protein [Irregularibacter muris]|uniref:Prepilin-type N-terminal cleavage/methylation domain-containing protein n=1 Tax=Irregularibacter muris TaxID=1796619 RepID=A0AAE3HIQ5_9FIRM|nr:prepilin-type N-terminal cleavage/methylation domain-containing protein [Irregularibacter muris]MCR1900065.1 prepilin-type N-terminal cleavage/methylation domain-containing protein [Irregularibacter muris]